MNEIPTWLFGFLVVAFFVLAAVGGLLFFQRITRNRLNLSEEMNNDIIFFASAISVFYSLTVGLIAVGVWSSYTEVKNIVSQEAASIAALYRDVGGYPEPVRGDLQKELRDYTTSIIEQAWPAQQQGVVRDGGDRMVTVFQDRLFSFEPKTLGQQALHAEALRQFNHMIELRRLRIESVEGGLPAVMWGIVLIGAALSISVTYLLKIQRPIHVVLTAFLAMFIGLVVFVVAGLDNPLSGPLAISPESYQIILDTMSNSR